MIFLWIFVTVLLVITSLVILFSGVAIGVGNAYDNPEKAFNFEPYAIGFMVTNVVNVLFNILMVIKSRKI